MRVANITKSFVKNVTCAMSKDNGEEDLAKILDSFNEEIDKFVVKTIEEYTSEELFVLREIYYSPITFIGSYNKSDYAIKSVSLIFKRQ